MDTIAELEAFLCSLDADISGVSINVDKGDQKLSIFKLNNEYQVLSPLFPGIHRQVFNTERDAVRAFLKTAYFSLGFRNRQHDKVMLKYFRENWNMD